MNPIEAFLDKWCKEFGIDDREKRARLRGDLESAVFQTQMVEEHKKSMEMTLYLGRQSDTFSQFWAQSFCPKCKAENWVYTGSSQRHYTGVDPEGYICNKCDHREVWSSSDFGMDEKAAEMHLDVGKKDPHD